MTTRSLFAEQLDEDAVVACERRWAGTTTAPAPRFAYPDLDAPLPPPAPAVPVARFDEDELARAVEDARRAAYDEAEAKVRAEIAASLEHRQAEAHGLIAAQMAAAATALERTLAARAVASRDLALAFGRALAARALALQPLADVEAMLRSLVLRLEGQPWLEVALPPQLLRAGEAALARAADEAGYQGELRVLPDPALGPGDARVRWQEGCAERDLARIEAEAAALVETWLPADHHQAHDAPAPAAPACAEETET